MDDRRHRVLEKALAGEETAQTQLVGCLTPVIQARVGQWLLYADPGRRSRQSVEDLTQEVFIILFENDARILRHWDPKRGASLENFVGRVAELRVRSLTRSQKRDPWAEETVEDVELGHHSPEADPERRRASQELLELLLERLRATLSPLGWNLFQLLFLHELPVEEVSRITDQRPDSVYQWRRRLRKKARQLRDELKADERPDSDLAEGDCS